jgi:hypothetical protein
MDEADNPQAQAPATPDADKQKKSVGWRLSVGLRKRVAAEAKASGEEIEALVEKWLAEKVNEAEEKRYRRKGSG